MKTEMTCKTCRTYLPDLLLDEEFAASRPEVAIHLAACADCGTELNELRATFALLDEYTAPEPSPYFDSRLHARLREAQAAEPESLWERVKSFVSFSGAGIGAGRRRNVPGSAWAAQCFGCRGALGYGERSKGFR
jgi:hypothetical protein